MSTNNEIIYWLALINDSGLRLNLIKPVIQRWCLTERRSLSELVDLSPLELTTTFGLSDDQAERLIRSTARLEVWAGQLEQWLKQGIEPILRTDPRFPKRLVYYLLPVHQPLLLWIRGADFLLNQAGVTLLGQQDPEASTSDFIKTLMLALEHEEVGLISGYGRGLDRSSFEAMLKTPSGYTTAVLPMGLNAFADTTSRLDAAIEAKRTLLISPFNPDTPYQERLAEARNLLIDHLTMALLIPESDETSQDRAMAALERGLPVFVKADTANNRSLIERGALLLTDPGEVIDWVQQAIIDAAMRAEEEAEEAVKNEAAAPLTMTAPTEAATSHDDFALHSDDVALLGSTEALEILSLGGEVPEVLRERLKKKLKE
jgi:predicted Rossmann fold nucleotide-binding protein DprA/Smf involved in DNA uptake